jgi:hypothetical protein
MPEVDLVVQYPVLLVVALVLGAVVAAAVAYRTTVPPLSRVRRLVLAVLRGSVLAILVFLIAQPLLRLVISHERPPSVALLLDDSQSMQLRDAGGSRAHLLDSLLRVQIWGALARSGDVAAYSFGASLRSLPDPAEASLAYDEEITDISGALLELARERDRRPLDAVVLLTDGIHTSGRNPVYAAERLGLPLITVGIGDSSAQRDLVLSRVLANELVYEGVSSPVDITVRSTGFGGERIRVSLREGRTELASSEIRLEEGTREYDVHLDYVPGAEGSRKLTASVSRLAGELTTENNAQSFYIRVLRSRLRVLILAGAPTPDATVLQLSLSEDERFAVRLLTAGRGGQWFGGTLGSHDLDSADCLVLVGFPSAVVAASTLDRVKSAVLDRNLPLLFISGPSLDGSRLRAMGDLLPFTVDLPSTVERLSGVAPVPEERNHPLLSPGGPEAWRDWEALPPIYTTMSVVTPRPGVIVLARVRSSGGGGGEPFLLARRSGPRSSLALLGYGLWRWRLMGQAAEQTADFHARFFSTAIVWLSSREEMRPVRVRPSREFFRQGEPVLFGGQVYDALQRPVDNARVTVTVRQEQQSFQTDLRPVGSGRYEGELYGLAEGEARYEAAAVLEGVALGSDSGRVSVGGTNVEFQNTRMDPALLRELAALSGGRFLLVGEIDSLRQALAALPSYHPHTEVRRESRALWDWPVILVLLIVLLALEWALRKRSGML